MHIDSSPIIILQNHLNMIITSRLNGVLKVDTSLFPVQFIENINVNDSNQNRAVNVRLLCGADLLESFAVPGLWNDDDVRIIIYCRHLKFIFTF